MMVAREVALDVVAPERATLGESPVWDERAGALYWCDITPGILHRLELRSGVRQQWSFGEPLASMGLCRSGRLILALVRNIVLFDPASGVRQELGSVVHGKPDMRLNDGKVGPDGAFWVGSGDASGDGAPAGTLYRVSLNGGIEIVATGLRVSNGLAWSPDGTRMYHSDSRGPHIDILDFDPRSGVARNRRRWVTLDEDTGRPDGGACDNEGHYWSAGVSAGVLNRFDPDGRLVDRIAMPSLHPTMPCFGGDGLATLYVTSLSSSEPADVLARNPLCGAVVSFRPGVSGAAVARFDDQA